MVGTLRLQVPAGAHCGHCVDSPLILKQKNSKDEKFFKRFQVLIMLLELFVIVVCVLSLIDPNLVAHLRDHVLVATERGSGQDHPFRDERNLRIALSVALGFLVACLVITVRFSFHVFSTLQFW